MTSPPKKRRDRCKVCGYRIFQNTKTLDLRWEEVDEHSRRLIRCTPGEEPVARLCRPCYAGIVFACEDHEDIRNQLWTFEYRPIYYPIGQEPPRAQPADEQP